MLSMECKSAIVSSNQAVADEHIKLSGFARESAVDVQINYARVHPAWNHVLQTCTSLDLNVDHLHWLHRLKPPRLVACHHQCTMRSIHRATYVWALV